MLKKYFKKYLPSYETVRENRWFRPFTSWLHHPNLWHLNRRSVAGGAAVGLFAGLFPGPTQVIGGALLAVLFRVNLPVALIATFYSNPFTIVPLYMLAYKFGSVVTGYNNNLSSTQVVPPEFSWDNWFGPMLEWILSLGKPLAVGLPLLALTLAVVGYFAVRLVWYMMVVWEWRRRAERRRLSK